MIIDDEKPWARIVLGAAGIGYVAYCFYTGHFRMVGLTGLVLWAWL